MTAQPLSLSPSHPVIRRYYRSLTELRSQDVEHETALRHAFQNLLADTARLHGWTLIPELGAKAAKAGGSSIRPDGTLRDANSLPRGHWEAKDERDDLERAIRRKIDQGYPTTNIIFEDTRRAVLFQDRQRALEADLSDPRQVAGLLDSFYRHTEPAHRDFHEAVDEFEERVPDLARGLAAKIDEAHHANRPFQDAFASFFALCQASLNPNLRREAVDEMLVQHLLTERLFRNIFDNPEFTRRNAIAVEVERVIDALVSESFSRTDYLKGLDRFYVAIESAARTITDFGDKQHFLNTIYERFFRGYSVKLADTHGIVYTPPAIVNYMWTSVAEALQSEFGLDLSSPGVTILDPCTGTGNFIANLLPRLPRRDLPRVYSQQLFANEVMLMPYYIAALNIEHAYLDLTGRYEPFEGLCFVDTLDMAEGRQMTLFTEKNTARVARQRQAPITVIIGNPPYNVGQLNENDNNKNRKYDVIDRRVSETYARDSKATNKNALSDPYVKFFRWATDRLGDRDGIICLVSNNGFLHGIAFDGFRRHLQQDFHRIEHFDLKGNARTTAEQRRREGGNIFSDQIRVGVGITLLVRNARRECRELRYHRVADYWKAEEKRLHLASFGKASKVPWQLLTPDASHAWLVPTHATEYAQLLPITEVFERHSRGVATCRDDVVYDFHRDPLIARVRRLIDDYNAEVDRYRRAGSPPNVDDFVRYDLIKWSRDLKADLQRQRYAAFDDDKLRNALYRPFTKCFLFFDRILNEEVYQFPRILPIPATEQENLVIQCTNHTQIPFSVFVCNVLPEHAVSGRAGQCFPFYTYDPDGSNRRENITDLALDRFRTHYRNPQITKWDVFHYIYALLHHPAYRERFADNLKRELPRIPFASDFAAFVQAGSELARLHVGYEQLEPWPLQWIEDPKWPLSYRVERMRLSKDKTSLAVNPSLTLAGLPPEAFDYRLGNRSALEWVIDQYRVTGDPPSDPNRDDDPEYIVRLVGQVVRVSVETVRVVRSLPPGFG